MFSGDTLFNAGAGNCHSGDPALLYDTFSNQLAHLPDNTLIYPGHEYLGRNLAFTLDREPGNQDAATLAAETSGVKPEAAPVTTLEQEKRINAFFRLQSPALIARLREKFPELGERPDPRSVFLKLRELRNTW